MAVIGLQGIRGGVGTTSIAAALGWALQQLGESVLVIDASPANMLRLFFNIELADSRGWARSMLDNQPWEQAGWRYVSHLDILPFGNLTAAEQLDFGALAPRLAAFSDSLARLKASGRYQWILLDLPAETTPLTRQLLDQADHIMTVVRPDANCHIRLHQQLLPEGALLLVNYLLVGSKVQDDIYQLWISAQPRLVPIAIHRDEAVSESLAMKQPPGEYQIQSLAAEEVLTLANWCLLRLAGRAE
ncbi:cellulose biosynthesis protein BcsQ [Entomohabitans teleogrylli]|uniref:cellulose biosynthesis protein BcsQ n=1 Tax=Entomohabitans teleogrylli TaxID=1384589 RepID=UPI00073D48E9|nr:cellulose biosynthesis protein BcsQ [Entomohabitans teleogrylli]